MRAVCAQRVCKVCVGCVLCPCGMWGCVSSMGVVCVCVYKGLPGAGSSGSQPAGQTDTRGHGLAVHIPRGLLGATHHQLLGCLEGLAAQ